MGSEMCIRDSSCFLQLDNDGPQLHALYSFAVITDEEEILLAANSEEEKYKWMEVRFQLADVPRSKVVFRCFRCCFFFSVFAPWMMEMFLQGLNIAFP